MNYVKKWNTYNEENEEPIEYGTRGVVSIEEFDKGKTYTYSTIEMFVIDKRYHMSEHGKNVVGENFLVLSHPNKDEVISFVLSGHTSENIYECVYSDMKN